MLPGLRRIRSRLTARHSRSAVFDGRPGASDGEVSPQMGRISVEYVALLRGINVGGKNKVVMSELREQVAGVGYTNVRTYIKG